MDKSLNSLAQVRLVSAKIFAATVLCVAAFLSLSLLTPANFRAQEVPVFKAFSESQPPPVKRVKKTILLYNDFFGDKYWQMGEGNAVFKNLNCQVSDCFITADKAKFKDSAAVAFHVPRIGFPTPAGRPPDQVWLFFAMESPLNVKKLPESWRNQFNRSITYHTASDYLISYGEISKRRESLKRNWSAIAEQKTKTIAWFVSNCHASSKRMEYVKRLAKVIPVDIWGDCGPNKCNSNKREHCLSLLNSTYKFYLSFENSFCEDYVTEKFFRYSMYDLVVVVRGAANYSRHAPPGSFINTADFQSPEDLGNYLKYLDQNTTEYIKYLQWKENYSVRENGLKQTFWCDICRDLSDASPRTPVLDPYDLWFDRKRCWPPSDV